MTLTFELPPSIEDLYRAEAQARGLAVDELVRELLILNSPSAPRNIEDGLGLFGSAVDSALLDEAVAIALADRRHPSSRI